MNRKPSPFIPIESLKTQRVEVYINDLQKQLHQLRTKYDTIFTECCDIQKKIQEVSSETLTKQREIGRIISEFEELRLSSASRGNVLKKAVVQKVGDVRHLREKFEKMFQENLEELIVQAKNSIETMGFSGATPSKPQTSCEKPADDQQDSELWSTYESFYSFSSAPSQDIPESLSLEVDEVAEAID